MTDNDAFESAAKVLRVLQQSRNIQLDEPALSNAVTFRETFSSLDHFLRHIAAVLHRRGDTAESQAISHVSDLCVTDIDLGGLGLQNAGWADTSAAQLENAEFLVDAWLAAIDSAMQEPVLPLEHKRPGTRPMTLAEKIFAHHALSGARADGVRAGDLVRVAVDWIIASEVTWVGMKKSMASVGQAPRAWRNDRFWLAGDHVVDPRNYSEERVKGFVRGLQSARKELKMTENQGLNYTILHTEFVRERAEPGMLVLGSDSHTCSAGAVSCLAIGLGAGDVMMGLVTGQTWFKIPESIRIDFVGKPAWYIRGKDVVLSILKQLKRNTYAADRIIEFGGPGAGALSCDARFAISNMCTELGAITGVFVPDEVTRDFVEGRKRKMYKYNSLYFEPDDDATYAARFTIDLGRVESFIAIYPSPDDVHAVPDRLGMQFDGCFIGACTTTEEDLVLAALVLRVGLERGLPITKGRRVVVPGSMPIVRNLKKLGLLDVYAEAGFERPAPGCSLCIGIGADIAEQGSNWLSSQNRNFKNRMGKGAIGHICSAATVAASSFNMFLTDPRDLLKDVSEDEYIQCLEQCRQWRKGNMVKQVEKSSATIPKHDPSKIDTVEPNFAIGSAQAPLADTEISTLSDSHQSAFAKEVRSKIYRMGDFVDTDAIIPAVFCTSGTDEQLGSHCFEFSLPDFRESVKSATKVVVGEKAFGCGSSREEAARALKGLGVECVIAKTFSFIFGRNAPTIGLLAITILDDEFYRLAQTGVEIRIDVSGRMVHLQGGAFPFSLDEMEVKLIQNRGLPESFRKFGNRVFEMLCRKDAVSSTALADVGLGPSGADRQEVLAW
ncbi:aconitase [Periconia macrospinosa]|uniref:Aconitase n=1 Tax=Periconia macrospinosa TaxID=97972 RepID=A0A2V1DAG1_9PLEO|nr:aconitase [Periconia macrospinosa]